MAALAWIIVRDPHCIPVRKGPFQPAELAPFLRELMDARPYSFLTVVNAEGDIHVQDGPECLQMIDGRSMRVARRHNERLRAIVLRPEQEKGEQP